MNRLMTVVSFKMAFVCRNCLAKVSTHTAIVSRGLHVLGFNMFKNISFSSIFICASFTLPNVLNFLHQHVNFLSNFYQILILKISHFRFRVISSKMTS